MTLRMTIGITLDTQQSLSIRQAQEDVAPRISKALRSLDRPVETIHVTGLEVVDATAAARERLQSPERP